MTCDKCVETIERALRDKRGVTDLKVDREGAKATITFDRQQTNLPELHEILLKSGYRPRGGVVE
jgi:copper chaperone